MPKKSAVQPPSLEWEIRSGHPRIRVAGVDEVGRGCLAGPVVAAAVILPPEKDFASFEWISEITDSKLLSPEVRERLSPLIQGWAVSWAIGVASVEEIDRINIYHASHLAMIRALEGLSQKPDHLLVDGNAIPKKAPCAATAIVKGDQKCLSIAAASIIAKVYRDGLIADAEQTHPGYGFAKHKGYSTPEHYKALEALGVCELHRRSFAPIQERIAAPRLPGL